MRILIAGWPRAGKTTLAGQISTAERIPVRDTDSLISTHAWSEASEVVAGWLTEPGPWICEGVAIPRALRKWLLAHPEGIPADVLHWSETPREALTKEQTAMGKGCTTVWNQVRDELVRRGLRVEMF